jgi:hypothetical protein
MIAPESGIDFKVGKVQHSLRLPEDNRENGIVLIHGSTDISPAHRLFLY